MTTDIKFPFDSTRAKVILVQLSPEESDVYFDSEWYKEQIKQKRHTLIEQGFIKDPAWHPNNPPHIQVPKPGNIVVANQNAPSIIIRVRQE